MSSQFGVSRSDEELPPRCDWDDLSSVLEKARRFGYDGQAEARLHSQAEWHYDLSRCQAMRLARGLSDAEWLDLAERFRERNRAVWGACCQAIGEPLAPILHAREGPRHGEREKAA